MTLVCTSTRSRRTVRRRSSRCTSASFRSARSSSMTPMPVPSSPPPSGRWQRSRFARRVSGPHAPGVDDDRRAPRRLCRQRPQAHPGRSRPRRCRRAWGIASTTSTLRTRCRRSSPTAFGPQAVTTPRAWSRRATPSIPRTRCSTPTRRTDLGGRRRVHPGRLRRRAGAVLRASRPPLGPARPGQRPPLSPRPDGAPIGRASR